MWVTLAGACDPLLWLPWPQIRQTPDAAVVTGLAQHLPAALAYQMRPYGAGPLLGRVGV